MPTREPNDYSPQETKGEIFGHEPEKIFQNPNNPTQRPYLRSRLKNFFSWFFILILFTGIIYGSFFLYKTYALSRKINIEINNPPDSLLLQTIKTITTGDTTQLKSQDDRINILLLGIAGVGKAGQNLTDTVMVASLNIKTKQVSLLSIPRDLFVTIPDLKVQMKINSVYQYGLSNSDKNKGAAAATVARTVEDIIALPINYYVILNFNGFEKIIDSLDGINIISELDIYDPRYPGPNFSYETFELAKGFHHLDGATALKYVRERHNDSEGDFGRAKRQQQVLQATKNKVFSVGTFLNPFKLNELFDALGDNITTNINPEELIGFMELAKKLDTQNINNMVIDAWNKESLLKVSHVFYGNLRSFVLVPRVGNWSEVHDLAKNIFDLNVLKRRQAEITNENASIGIINRSGDYNIVEKIRKLLNENFAYKNVFVLKETPIKLTEKTFVYDRTNGAKPFTLDEIAQKLPAQVSYEKFSLNIGSAQNRDDLVIVIGKDLISKYNMEEDTLEDLNKSRDDEDNLQIKNTN